MKRENKRKQIGGKRNVEKKWKGIQRKKEKQMKTDGKREEQKTECEITMDKNENARKRNKGDNLEN